MRAWCRSSRDLWCPDCLYVFGGQLSNPDRVSNDLWSFNLVEKRWTRLGPKDNGAVSERADHRLTKRVPQSTEAALSCPAGPRVCSITAWCPTAATTSTCLAA
jgi:hypothetical protein